jgi:lipopolysaccharide exporter
VWLWNLPSKFPFAANVAVLSGGASLGHCFTLAAAPILTRLYSPYDLGQFGLFNIFLSLTAIATALQYDAAIVSAPGQEQAAHLTKLSMLFTVPVGITGGLLLHLMIHLSFLGFGTLPVYAPVLMALTIVFSGLFSILRYWSIRDERFGVVSQAMILQNGGRAISQVALGMFQSHGLGLLVGEVFGRSLGMGRMMRNTWPAVSKYALSLHDAAKALRENRRFPLYSMPSALMNQLGTALPLPLLASLYGADSAGYYSLVWRVLALPVVLLSYGTADAFHSRAALYAREDMGSVLQLFHKTSSALLLIGMVPALALSIYGQPLFGFVFGSRWRISGTIAVIVAPWFLASFVVSPLSRLVFVLQGQRFKLIYDVLILGGNLGLFFLSRQLGWPMIRMITAMSGLNTASNVVYYLVLLRIATTATRNWRNDKVS